MLQSDMSWHHPISSDRQDGLMDSYLPNPQPPHPTAQPTTDWDLFTSPADFENTINALQVGASSATAREPSYDLFNTNPNTFGPTSRFRSDSSSSSYSEHSPNMPVTYDYLYGPQSANISPPSSAVNTRPNTASYGFISPEAVAPPSFAELMMDSQSAQFAYQQQLSPTSQHRFNLGGYDIQSPNPMNIRAPIRHASSSSPYVQSPAFHQNAFDPQLSAPLVKREELPFNFGASVGINPAYPAQHQFDSSDLQSFIR